MLTILKRVFGKPKRDPGQKPEEAEKQRNDTQEGKRGAITRAQIDQLSDYLFLRYSRIQKGELFNVEGHPPTKPTGIMQVDSAVMLIAMDECVTSIGIAEDALRCTLKLTFDKMGAGARSPDASQIDLSFQRELLLLKQKDQDKGWVASLCAFALLYLFEIPSKGLTQQESSAFTQMGAKNVDEIWEVYAKTKNIFGHDLDTKGLFSDSPRSQQSEGKAVLSDPKAFAEWLLEYFVCTFPFKDDLSLAPSPDQCDRFKISESERIACGNEYVLLRALAAILYLKRQGVPADYTSKFQEVLLASVRLRMEKHAAPGHDPKVSAGISAYLHDFTSEDPALPFCLTYLGRVYPDNPIADSMVTSKNIEVPLELGFKYVVKHMGLVHEAVSSLAGVQPSSQ